MTPVRLGAVSYLNTKPLVHGLEDRSHLFSVRYDVPAQCAALLHEGRIDVGLIPAIEYHRGTYRIVPGVAIGSDGPIASVALFSRVPPSRVQTLALDVSSRTSAALTQILCAKRWHIAPHLLPSDPDLGRMLDRADAALLIGDPALTVDPAAHGATKIDLGSEWKALTGLPFVYAMWAGRDGIIGPAHVAELNAARDRGVAAIEPIAARFGGSDDARRDRARAYLRDNLKYGLGETERAGLNRFFELAAEVGLVSTREPLRFYDER
jgi:chorismate dehydratase